MKSATEKKALVLTICKLNIQNGHHLFGFQMVGLFGIKMELKKMDHLASQQLSTIQTLAQQIFRSPLYLVCYI